MNGDQFEILVTAAVSAVTVGLVGLGAGYLVRRRSLLWQFGLVAAVAVLAVLAGVLAIARRMFLSRHDLEVVTLVTTDGGGDRAGRGVGARRRAGAVVPLVA